MQVILTLKSRLAWTGTVFFILAAAVPHRKANDSIMQARRLSAVYFSSNLFWLVVFRTIYTYDCAV